MAHSAAIKVGRFSGDDAEDHLRSLVHASKAGDQLALNQLLQSSTATIRNVARKIIHDPDELSDVVQHVCLKLVAALDSFDESRRFGTWLYRVTVNCAIDHSRQLRRHAHLTLEDAHSVESPVEQDPEHQTISHERELRLRQAAAHLPEHQQRLLLRHELDGISVKELSREGGQPVSAVRWHLVEARRKLRRELKRTYRPAALRTLFE